MALLNEILVGRYNRLVQKLLSMKGPANLVQLRGEMGVEIPLFHGAENRYLESWDLFGAVMAPGAGGAGNFNSCQIRNPAGSNVIAVVESILIGNVTAADYATVKTLYNNIADETNVITVLGIDPRSGSGAGGAGRNSTLIASSGIAALVAGFNMNIRFGAFPATSAIELLTQPTHEIPLLPNTGLATTQNTANQSFSCAYFWRERFLEESERK